MEFALENTLVRDMHGNILKQTLGIPMGDPHSPGMAIGACAWMEKLWMESLHHETKNHFRAKRYMDDILMVYAQSANFEHTKFLGDFGESTCYWPPLNLEDGGANIFLETDIRIQDNSFRHKLKNDNAATTKIWRYMHFDSSNHYSYKCAALKNSLKKVEYMASDDSMLIDWKRN